MSPPTSTIAGSLLSSSPFELITLPAMRTILVSSECSFMKTRDRDEIFALAFQREALDESNNTGKEKRKDLRSR